MYSLISIRTILFSSSNRLAASVFAALFLPTPVGPRNREGTDRLCRIPDPALERMIASVTFSELLHPDRQHVCGAHRPDEESYFYFLLVSFATGIPGPAGDDPCDLIFGNALMDKAQICVLYLLLLFLQLFFSCGSLPYWSLLPYSDQYFCYASWI